MLRNVISIKHGSCHGSIFDAMEYTKVMVSPISTRLSHPFVKFGVPSHTSVSACVVRSYFRIHGIKTFVSNSKIAQAIIKFVLVYMVNKASWPLPPVESPYDCMSANLNVKQRPSSISSTINSSKCFFPSIFPVPDRTVMVSRLLPVCKKIKCPWKPSKLARGKITPKKFLGNVNGWELLFHVFALPISSVIVHDRQRGQLTCGH
jgi:hypothetical protein